MSYLFFVTTTKMLSVGLIISTGYDMLKMISLNNMINKTKKKERILNGFVSVVRLISRLKCFRRHTIFFSSFSMHKICTRCSILHILTMTLFSSFVKILLHISLCLFLFFLQFLVLNSIQLFKLFKYIYKWRINCFYRFYAIHNRTRTLA